MWEKVMYLRTEGRRPVRLTPYRAEEDMEAAVPFGWCPGCGMELYSREERLCRMCERWGRDENMGAACAVPQVYPDKGCARL